MKTRTALASITVRPRSLQQLKKNAILYGLAIWSFRGFASVLWFVSLCCLSVLSPNTRLLTRLSMTAAAMLGLPFGHALVSISTLMPVACP